MNPGFPRAAASLSVLASLALLLLSLPASSRAQTSGGTLNGETLGRTTVMADDAAFRISNLNCTQGGVAGFDFTTSGTATGPYPGTYTESGSVTFQNAPGGVILGFSSQFTITSGANVITGTKQLAPAQPPEGGNNRGSCQVSQNGPLTITNINVVVAAQYTASVPTATGSVSETGTSRVVGSWNRAVSPAGISSGSYSFNETYRNLAQITTVTLTPAAAVNPVGTSHTVTATASNASGGGVSGARVYFDVAADGSSVVSFQCLTNASGQCSFLYQGPEFPRADSISACVDRDDSGSIDPADPCAAATKTWVFPASTRGASNGGGHFLDAATGTGVNFGFSFKSDAGGAKGSCHVNDKARDTAIKCLDVLAYVQGVNEATVYGTAEANGAQTYFKLVLTEDASGSGDDTFSIITQSGYAAGGVVTQGNVHVHTP
ncbi:MAG: post-COAP-1 domain-containing protein [Pyrinomonadaceae bacterium]